MKSSADVVREFIDAFIDAWPRGDAAGVAGYFSDKVIYHNGPLEPAIGRGAIQDAFAELMALGGTVSVELRHLLSDDKVALTERVDYFVSESRTIALPVMGMCEVQDGLITAWRDYLDLSQLNG
jgi:limonene-1,2-epoxide hydrolase